MRWFLIVALATGAVVVGAPRGATVAHAQGVPGVSPNKCLSGKTKCVGKMVDGLLKCRAKCQANPGSCSAAQTACEAKVREKFDDTDPSESCFEQLEAKSGTGDPAKDCTTFDDRVAIGQRVDTFTTNTVSRLEGGPVDACPLSPATGQTTCWDTAGTVVPCPGTGQDGDIQAGAPLAYQDNGDGTITDLTSGLMWEKKSDDGGINDKDDFYTLDDAINVHLANLNAASGFAGRTDWRLPNVREMSSIVNYENVAPATSPVFNNGCVPGCSVLTCSCTFVTSHKTSTTYSAIPNATYVVGFYGGHVGYNFKNFTNVVRAVRSQ